VGHVGRACVRDEQCHARDGDDGRRDDDGNQADVAGAPGEVAGAPGELASAKRLRHNVLLHAAACLPVRPRPVPLFAAEGDYPVLFNNYI
jgi:hypothetical protein